LAKISHGPAEESNRRFPPPWFLEEQEACFVVRDHNGQQLAYVYFEDESGRRSAAKLSTVSKKSRRGDRSVQAISASDMGPNARGGN